MLSDKRIKGGLHRKDPEKTGFRPIYDMIEKSTKFEPLFMTSLYGFILDLSVKEEDSEYLGLDETREFTKPVVDYVLKLVVLSKIHEVNLHTPYTGYMKRTMIISDFIKEAKYQHNIWMKSIERGEPICPSVANLSILKNTPKTIAYFQSIVQKHTTDAGIASLFQYLQTVMNHPTTIGIGFMLMPKINQSETMSKLIMRKKPEEQSAAINAFVLNLCRLYLEGFLHADLHSSNTLVYTDDDRKIKNMIIDFGRVSDANIGLGDKYLCPAQKNGMCRSVSLSINQIKASSNPEEIYGVVRQILSDIIHVENYVSQKQGHGTPPQMYWVHAFIIDNAREKCDTVTSITPECFRDENVKYVAERLFEIYKTEPKKVSGNFIKFGLQESSYVDDLMYVDAEEETPMCDLFGFCRFGGGRKASRKARLRKKRCTKRRKT